METNFFEGNMLYSQQRKSKMLRKVRKPRAFKISWFSYVEPAASI